MAVRWYVAYPLSYRNIEELMAERNVEVDHATLQRWVVEYSPQLETEFRKSYKNRTNRSWRMDVVPRKIQETLPESVTIEKMKAAPSISSYRRRYQTALSG